MTTPKKKKSPPRKVKPPAPRKGPDRSGKTSKRASKGKSASSDDIAKPLAFGQGSATEEADFDDKVSDFVKSAYDALSETIGQGRRAAEQFRQGEYNFRQVPGDMEEMTRRMLQLARQLSSTTFDVCEQLIGQLSDFSEPPAPGTTKVDAFRRHKPAGDPGKAPPSSASHSGGNGAMRLVVEFAGKKSASSPTTSMERPAKPTKPDELRVTELTHVDKPETTIPKAVEFSADLAAGGVVATVTIPAKQPIGVYVGYIHTTKDKVPLGLLQVKVGK